MILYSITFFFFGSLVRKITSIIVSIFLFLVVFYLVFFGTSLFKKPRQKFLKNYMNKKLVSEDKSYDKSYYYKLSKEYKVKLSETLKTTDEIVISYTLIEPLQITEETKIFLVLHGSNDNRFKCLQSYDSGSYIAQNAVFMSPDYRGFADSKGTFDPIDAAKDVDACVEYLRGKYNKGINIIGHSLGCAMATEYISLLAKNNSIKDVSVNDDKMRKIYQEKGILKVFLISPFFNVKVHYKSQNPAIVYFFLVPVLNAILEDYGMRIDINIRYLHSEDVMIIAGQNDTNIIPDISKELSKVNNCEFHLISGADHNDIVGLEDTRNKILENSKT